jgi:hypothetical protein
LQDVEDAEAERVSPEGQDRGEVITLPAGSGAQVVDEPVEEPGSR